MPDPFPGRDPRRRGNGGTGFAARLDRAAQDVNAFLLVLAFGLAALDASIFVAVKLRDALPRAPILESVAATPVFGFGGAFAAAPDGRTPLPR